MTRRPRQFHGVFDMPCAAKKRAKALAQLRANTNDGILPGSSAEICGLLLVLDAGTYTLTRRAGLP